MVPCPHDDLGAFEPSIVVLRCVLGVGSGSSSFLFFWWVRLRSPGLLLSLIFLGTRHVGPQKGDNIVVLLNRLGTRRVLDDTIETVNGPGRRAFLIVRDSKTGAAYFHGRGQTLYSIQYNGGLA